MQHLALFIYRLQVIHLQKLINIHCFKSGTGTLYDIEPELNDINRYVWPMEIKSILIEKLRHQQQHQQQKTTITMMTGEELIYERLQYLNGQTEQFQQELNNRKKQLIGFTSKIEEMIEKFIYQTAIQPLRLQCDLKIVLIKLDYDDEMIERKFYQENPNEYQVSKHSTYSRMSSKFI